MSMTQCNGFEFHGSAGSGHFRSARRRAGGELWDWLKLFDSLLTAIERTAWSARGLAEAGRRTFEQGERELGAQSRRLQRFAETGFVLGQIAGSYRLERLQRAFSSRRRAKARLTALHAKNARRFQSISVKHGGAFLKVGQLLSARADVLPNVWVTELAKLQDACLELDFATVERILESELGRPLGEVFASFDPKPVAAASIGQVHRATLLDGRAVAVKIQRPGIEECVRSDLDLLEAFLAVLAADSVEMDISTITNEIRAAVLAELDYLTEAETTSRVARFFADSSRITSPEVVTELSGERVLVTHFIEGEKITTVLDQLEAQKEAGDEYAHAQLSTILGRLLEAYLRQVLELGWFQADPHPGNLRVTLDDRVCILDFGCSGALPPELRARYLNLFQAGLFGDRARVAQHLVALGFETRSGRPDTLHRFVDTLLGELRQVACGAEVRWPSAEEVAKRARGLLEACIDDPVVRVPREFVLIGRIFATLSGFFSRYQPDIDFSRHVLPVLGQALFSAPAAD